MKIISNFSDYYDMGLAYGIDEKIRFERKTNKIDKDITIHNSIKIKFKKNEEEYLLLLWFNLIGFCDELYPFIHLVLFKHTKKNKEDFYKKQVETFAYNIEKAIVFIEKNHKSIDEVEYRENYYSTYNISLQSKLDKFYTREFNCLKKKFKKWKWDSPYFFIIVEGIPYKESVTVLSLPLLKKYKFSQAMPPLEAFQKLSMYLGAKNEEKEITQIEDKYLAQGKGFDCYSFKKMPSKKKVKKCKK